MALDAIEQLLVADHGFTVTPEGAVVSPNGKVRNVVNGKTTFTPYTPPTTEPTLAETFAAQFAAIQEQAIANTNQVRQDEAVASGQDTYQSVATDGSGVVTDVFVGTPVNLQPEIINVGTPTFSSGSPTQAAAPSAPSAPAAPVQTTDQLEAAIDEANDLDLDPPKRFKNRTSDLTGIKYTDKKAYEYDLGPEYDNVVAVKSGKSVKFYKDGERVDSDVLGIDSLSGETGNEKISSLFGQLKRQEVQEVYDQFGGEEGALVSEYLANEAAAAQRSADADERSDDRDAQIQKNLKEQVQREADALGITTTQYYNLPFSQRAGMAAADLGEVFDSSQGQLFQNPNDIDPNNPRNLGVLGSENIERFQNVDDKDSIFFTDALAPNTTYTTDPAYLPYDASQDLMFMGEADAQDYPLAGGLNIPGTGLTITAGDPVGPGAGGGDGNGGGGGPDIVVVPPVVPPVGPPEGPLGPRVPVIGPRVIDGGTGGGGIGSGVPVAGTMPDPSTYIVPSTANYGTDPRFANLAPTYNVSNAPMPIFDRFDPAPSIPIVPVEEEETSLLAQGGIVSLSEGGEPFRNKMGVIGDENMRDGERYYFEDYETNEIDPQMLITPERLKDRQDFGVIRMAETPKGQGISPDFMVDTYYPSLIPKALDGNKAAKEALLEAHSKLDNFTLPEELLLRIKRSFRHGGVAERGYSHEGVGSLSDTARNMFRPMVS